MILLINCYKEHSYKKMTYQQQLKRFIVHAILLDFVRFWYGKREKKLEKIT